MSLISRLKRCESGAPMVEFALVMPLILLFLAVIIEGGRITWIHQSTSAGVRDASRMIARIAPLDLCETGTPGDFQDLEDLATDIVETQLDGSTVIPAGAILSDVSFACFERAGDYRLNPTSVVEVTADVRIDLIFGGIFDFFGDGVGALNFQVADQSRVYGV
ncbi:TadE/TadG family type IV pilus assembly protein [Ruegeria lacuscaerulensis]|uniref:TadE/TadG family type IV pilus assembly protein n=1 Tax=Ruegeria lacuscaerulensis TaxID=55218 RepID=UPI001481AB2E|nr:TadE family protein [Ruegeria lacuscaerulensis]